VCIENLKICSDTGAMTLRTLRHLTPHRPLLATNRERCSIALTGGLSPVQTSFFSLAQPSKLDGKQAHQETSELDVRSASAFAVREEAGSCRTVTC